jgi:signal transduction histidine kinase
VRRRLLVGFVLFAFIATALLVVPIGLVLQSREGTNTLHLLRRDTSALSVLLTDAFNHEDSARAAELARSYSRTTGRQVLVVDADGVVLASRPSQGKDHSLVAVAQSAGRKVLSGTSSANKSEGPQYYAAVWLRHVSTDVGMKHVVLVVTSPVNVANDDVRGEWRDLAFYGLLMLIVACFFGVIVSGSLMRPLRRIGGAVEAVGHGSLDVRVPEDTGPPELRALARAINSTSSRLISLLESQRAFVEDASHQLRTPLTSLQLHLENLQTSEELSATSDLHHVLAEMNRLSRMVDSLLALARNESKSPVLVAIDVQQLVLERADVWRALAAEMGLELVIDAPSELSAFAVEDVFEQILDNLLSNAFDATPEDGQIVIRAFGNETHVEIHVVDNGRGLDEAERALALRRFWRGRENQSDGTGLGLSIVAQLVQLSHGTIELRGSEAGGIDATIVLLRA